MPQPSRQIVEAGGSLPVSAAVRAGSFVYVSATHAEDTSGSVNAQTRQSLDRIASVLRSAGSSLDNTASVLICLRNASDFASMNEAYATYWTNEAPARSTVIVTSPFTRPDALVEISAVAVADGADRTAIHPGDWIRSPFPYSYGIRSGDTLFVSGLVSRNGKENTPVKGDITVQTRTVLDNGGAILSEAGMSYADVVSCRIWLRDAASFQEMNAVYRTYFPSAPPARATVQTGLSSADSLLALTMVAVKDAGREVVTTPAADGSPGTVNPNLSSAIRAGNKLFVSGILGHTPGTKGDVKGQTAEALARIARTLKAAGFEWRDVVDSIVYLPDTGRAAEMDDAYRSVLSTDFPARTTIGAGLMGADGLVEIMVTAVR